MNHLLNILRGARIAFTLAPKPRGYRVDGDGFRADAGNLRGDFATVGRDLSNTISDGNKLEQANNRPRKGR